MWTHISSSNLCVRLCVIVCMQVCVWSGLRLCVFAGAIFEVQRTIQEAKLCLIRKHTHTPGWDNFYVISLLCGVDVKGFAKPSFSHDTDNSKCYRTRTQKHHFIFRTGSTTSGQTDQHHVNLAVKINIWTLGQMEGNVVKDQWRWAGSLANKNEHWDTKGQLLKMSFSGHTEENKSTKLVEDCQCIDMGACLDEVIIK